MVLTWIASRTRSSLLEELKARLQLLEAEQTPLGSCEGQPHKFNELSERQKYLLTEITDCKLLMSQVNELPEEGIPTMVQIRLDHTTLPYEKLTPEMQAMLS